MVSILIPLHGGADRTAASLAAGAAGDVEHEVITVEAGETGLVGAVNQAAGRAKGDFLAILNGGNEPREGWLAALVGRAEADASIAVVVPKVLSPGGLIHEAGGVLFADGTLWKYGNAHSETDPEFAYARDTDYGSAEALLVRADVWREIGGLDERFSPGFWSDADLCLAARALGHRVVYEPESVVVRPGDPAQESTHPWPPRSSARVPSGPWWRNGRTLFRAVPTTPGTTAPTSWRTTAAPRWRS